VGARIGRIEETAGGGSAGAKLVLVHMPSGSRAEAASPHRRTKWRLAGAALRIALETSSEPPARTPALIVQSAKKMAGSGIMAKVSIELHVDLRLKN